MQRSGFYSWIASQCSAWMTDCGTARNRGNISDAEQEDCQQAYIATTYDIVHPEHPALRDRAARRQRRGCCRGGGHRVVAAVPDMDRAGLFSRGGVPFVRREQFGGRGPERGAGVAPVVAVATAFSAD